MQSRPTKAHLIAEKTQWSNQAIEPKYLSDTYGLVVDMKQRHNNLIKTESRSHQVTTVPMIPFDSK